VLIEQTLQAVHGEDLTKLRTLEAAIEVVEGVVAAGEEDIRLEAQVFDMRQWRDMTAEIKAKEHVPWLKKFGEKIEVIDMETRTSRLATEEQVAQGRYFKNYNEYVAVNGVPERNKREAAAKAA
jgi:hypothetical protein